MSRLNVDDFPDVPTTPPGGSAALPDRAVDVWVARLDEPGVAVVQEMSALLSDDERQRAERFHFERDRRRFVIGRGILRTLLARYAGAEPAAVNFRYGPQGKPMLAPDSERRAAGGEPLEFNVAHSEDLALFAFTRMGAVGIDVERVRELPDWEQVAESVFSREERARLRECPLGERPEEFFRAWTRQEALLKALGTGLSGAMTHDGAETLAVYPLEPAPGFVAALATLPGEISITLRAWNSRHDPCPASAAASEAHLAMTATATFL